MLLQGLCFVKQNIVQGCIITAWSTKCEIQHTEDEKEITIDHLYNKLNSNQI